MNSVEQPQVPTVNSECRQDGEESDNNIFYQACIVRKIGGFLNLQDVMSLAHCCRVAKMTLEPMIIKRLRDRYVLPETAYHPYGDDHDKNLEHQKVLLDQLGELGQKCYASIEKRHHENIRNKDFAIVQVYHALRSSLPVALSAEVLIGKVSVNDYVIHSNSSHSIIKTPENSFFEIIHDENSTDDNDILKRKLIYQKGSYLSELKEGETISDNLKKLQLLFQVNKAGNQFVVIDDGVLIVSEKVDKDWNKKDVVKLPFGDGIKKLLGLKITNHQQYVVVSYEIEGDSKRLLGDRKILLGDRKILLIYDLMSQKSLRCLKNINSIKMNRGVYAIDTIDIFENSISLFHNDGRKKYCTNISYDGVFSISGGCFIIDEGKEDLKSYCGKCNKASVILLPDPKRVILRTFGTGKEEESLETMRNKVLFSKVATSSYIVKISPNGHSMLFEEQGYVRILEAEDQSFHVLCETSKNFDFLSDRLAFVKSDIGLSFFVKHKKTWVNCFMLPERHIDSVFMNTDLTKLIYCVYNDENVKIKCRSVTFGQKQAETINGFDLGAANSNHERTT